MSVKVFVKLQIGGENGAKVVVDAVDGRVGGTFGVDVEGFGVVLVPLDVDVIEDTLDVELAGLVDDSGAVEGFVVEIELEDDVVDFTDMIGVWLTEVDAELPGVVNKFLEVDAGVVELVVAEFVVDFWVVLVVEVVAEDKADEDVVDNFPFVELSILVVVMLLTVVFAPEAEHPQNDVIVLWFCAMMLDRPEFDSWYFISTAYLFNSSSRSLSDEFNAIMLEFSAWSMVSLLFDIKSRL